MSAPPPQPSYQPSQQPSYQTSYQPSYQPGPGGAGPHPGTGRPRGRGAPVWAKLVSVPLQLVLSLGLLGWTVGYTGQMMLQLQLRQPPQPVLFALCLLGVVVTAVLIGWVTRLSALGTGVAGLVWTVVGVVVSYAPAAQVTLYGLAAPLPRPVQLGLSVFLGYGGALVVGALLLGAALGTALTRRSRR